MMEKMVIDNEVLFGRVVELLGEGKQVTIPVKGYSMLPFIRGERDTVVLERAEAEALRPGDIVLFRYGGRYVLHRVIDVRDGVVYIQGDGVLQNQEHCPPGQIFGRVTTILRRGKRAVDPYSPRQMRRVRLWQRLQPCRRYLLIAFRLFPWNWWILFQQLRERKNNRLNNDE